jgi:hypothetical protein
MVSMRQNSPYLFYVRGRPKSQVPPGHPGGKMHVVDGEDVRVSLYICSTHSSLSTIIAAPLHFPAPSMTNYQRPTDPSMDFLTKFSLAVPTAITALANVNSNTPLDASYQPGCYDVVCGRGKGSYNRPGNRHFRALIATFLDDYRNAKTRVDKTAVLGRIVDKVHSLRDPHTEKAAKFVKFCKRSGWVQIGKDSAREKVGHAMREAIMAYEPLPLYDSDESTLSTMMERSFSSKRQCLAGICRRHPSFMHLSPFGKLR